MAQEDQLKRHALHDDEFFMREALAEASLAATEGEVPIGAVVVCEGAIVARAHNRREVDMDPSAHAEFTALVEAAHALNRWRLTGCTVYVTLEPCLMCAGLMVNARVDRCVYGAADPKGGALGSLYRLHTDARLNHEFEVTRGVLADECAGLLQEFFADLRKKRETRAVEDCEAGEHEVEEPCFTAVDAVCSCAACAGEGALSDVTAAPAPRVLLAIDSFKGCATSTQVEAWVQEGIEHGCPAAQVRCLPIADGGEGTIDAVAAAMGGEMRSVEVTGPFGETRRARYLLLDADETGRAAVMEMAEAAGITASPRTHEAALTASTYGVGQLMLDAVAAGATTIYMGLGGSATSDGGAGALAALGAQLLDAVGKPVAPGLAGLAQLASVNIAPALRALAGVDIVLLCDVTNPLVGARGALRVFGPQKGLAKDCADSEAVMAECDSWMLSYAQLLTAARDACDGSDIQVGVDGARPRSLAGVPGAGAAGGLGAALLALGAQMSSGIESVLDIIGFDEAVREADLVVTGEGNMDGQSAAGKAPVGVARRARAAGVPAVAVVGGRAANLDAVYAAGIDMVQPVCIRPMSLAEALSPNQAADNIRCAGETVIHAYLLK